MHSILTQTLATKPAQSTANHDSVKNPGRHDEAKKADASFDSVFDEATQTATVPKNEADLNKTTQLATDTVPVREEDPDTVFPTTDEPVRGPDKDPIEGSLLVAKQSSEVTASPQPEARVRQVFIPGHKEPTQLPKPSAEQHQPDNLVKEIAQAKAIDSSSKAPQTSLSSGPPSSATPVASPSQTLLHISGTQGAAGLTGEPIKLSEMSTRGTDTQAPRQVQPSTTPSPTAATLTAQPFQTDNFGQKAPIRLDPTHTQSQQFSPLAPRPESTAQPAALVAAPVPSNKYQGNRGKLDAPLPAQAVPSPAAPVKPNGTSQAQLGAVQPVVQTLTTETSKSSPALEVDPVQGLRTEASGSSAAPQSQTLPTRSELPQHMARQIAEAMQNMPNRPVEIRLNPEELGRVRLGVSSTEGNIMVTILAERPETGDLMRRHINALETAFQELGYSDINFAFAGESDSGQAENENGDGNGFGKPQHDAVGTDESPVQLHLNAAPVTGVDIRL